MALRFRYFMKFKLPKFCLFVFILLLTSCGVIFLVFGSLLVNHITMGIRPRHSFKVGAFGMTMGFIIIFISMLGLAALHKKNVKLLKLFILCLLCLIVILIIMGILVFVEKNMPMKSFDDHVKENMEKVFKKYLKDIDSTDDVDDIQQKCCGVDGPDYWLKVHKLTKLPASCSTDGNQIRYNVGCNLRVNNFIRICFGVIAYYAILTGLTQPIGVFLVIIVIRKGLKKPSEHSIHSVPSVRTMTSHHSRYSHYSDYSD